MTTRTSGLRATRAYTLIEILVVVVVLGICAASAIPSMGSASVLRAQAAVRTIVSDITFAQSDALAFQTGRAILFDQANNSWKICEIHSTIIDPNADLIYQSQIRGTDFGDAHISAVNFGGATQIYFDEMGGPVTAAQGTTPAPNGYLEVTGSGETYRVTVEGFTGRVTVQKM